MKEREIEQDVKKRPASSWLDMAGEMALHTRIAQSLFYGSREPAKNGLLQFAKTVSALWHAAKQDDPYAEWHLLKTWDALLRQREKIQSTEQQLTEKFSALRGITVDLSASAKPAVCSLRFSTPFGFMGASLLADADYVFRQLLTLERMGAPVDRGLFQEMARNIHDVFILPAVWQPTGVTRKDIQENNEKYQQAKILFGDLSSEVLENRIELPFLLRKKQVET